MNIALEVHLGFAFFVLLMALVIGWVQMGRRVMVSIIGIQILIGLIVSAWAGMARLALPPTLWLHITGGVLAMFAYIAARRVHERSSDKRVAAIGLSLLGLVLVGLTAWYGTYLYYYVAPLRG